MYAQIHTHTHTKQKIKAKPSAAIYVVMLPSEAPGCLCTTQEQGVCTGKSSWDMTSDPQGCSCLRSEGVGTQRFFTPCVKHGICFPSCSSWVATFLVSSLVDWSNVHKVCCSTTTTPKWPNWESNLDTHKRARTHTHACMHTQPSHTCTHACTHGCTQTQCTAPGVAVVDKSWWLNKKSKLS